MDGWWVWAEGEVIDFIYLPYAKDAAELYARRHQINWNDTVYAVSGSAPLEFQQTVEPRTREDEHQP